MYSQTVPEVKAAQKKRLEKKRKTVDPVDDLEDGGENSGGEYEKVYPIEEGEERVQSKMSKRIGAKGGDRKNNNSKKQQQIASKGKRKGGEESEDSGSSSEEEEEDVESDEEEQHIPSKENRDREQKKSSSAGNKKKQQQIGSKLTLAGIQEESVFQTERNYAMASLVKSNIKRGVEYIGAPIDGESSEAQILEEVVSVPKPTLSTEKGSQGSMDVYATIDLAVKFTVSIQDLKKGKAAEATVWRMDRDMVQKIAIDSIVDAHEKLGRSIEGQYEEIRKRAEDAMVSLKEIEYHKCYSSLPYTCVVSTPGLSVMNGLDVAYGTKGGLIVYPNSEYVKIGKKYETNLSKKKSLLDAYGKPFSRSGIKSQVYKSHDGPHYRLVNKSPMYNHIKSNATRYGTTPEQFGEKNAHGNEFAISKNMARAAIGDVMKIRSGLPMSETLKFTLKPADKQLFQDEEEAEYDTGSNEPSYIDSTATQIKYNVVLVCTAKVLIVA